MKDSYSFYKDRLQGEYRECFSQVEAYGMSKNVGREKWEERMMDLLDVFLSAQDEGKPVQKIVGNNPVKFCENFCAQFTLWDYVRSFLDAVKRCFWFVLVFTVLEVLVQIEEESFWQIKTDVGGYAGGLMIGLVTSYVLEFFVRQWMHRFKHFSMKAFYGLVIMQVVVCILAIAAIFELNLEYALTIHAWVVLAVSVVYLALYHFLTRKERKNREKVEFASQIAMQMPQERIRQFEKKNEKLAKKGKPLMTEVEYLDQLIKTNEKAKGGKVWLGFLGGLYLGGIIHTLCMGGFEDVPDFFIFLLVLTVIAAIALIPFLLLHVSLLKKVDQAEMEWILASKENGGFLRDWESVKAGQEGAETSDLAEDGENYSKSE